MKHPTFVGYNLIKGSLGSGEQFCVGCILRKYQVVIALYFSILTHFRYRAKMIAPDELFTLKNHYYLGKYEVTILGVLQF